jgi:hypothetical protein
LASAASAAAAAAASRARDAGEGEIQGVCGVALGSAPTALASQKCRSNSMDVCRGSAVSSRRADPNACGKSPRTPNARRHSSRLAFSSSVRGAGVEGAGAAGSLDLPAPGPSPLGPGPPTPAPPAPRNSASPRSEPEDGDAARPDTEGERRSDEPARVCAAPAAAAAAARPAVGAPAIATAPAGGGARPAVPIGGGVEPGAPGFSPATYTTPSASDLMTAHTFGGGNGWRRA